MSLGSVYAGPVTGGLSGLFQSSLHPSTSASREMSNCGLAASMPTVSHGAAARSAIIFASLCALGQDALANSIMSTAPVVKFGA